MKVYKFKVHGAGSAYDLIVQATSEADARAQAKEIAGRGHTATLHMWKPGTLDDYVGGEEFYHRVQKRHKKPLSWKDKGDKHEPQDR